MWQKYGTEIMIIAVLLFIIGALLYPAAHNYFTGNSVLVKYQFKDANTLQIGPVISSSIPKGYALYIYNMDPPYRHDGGYGWNHTDWQFVDSIYDIHAFETVIAERHEVYEAICVKAGADPKTAFTNDQELLAFDTMNPYRFSIMVSCQ